MSDATNEDKLTNMINDMKDRGSKEQEIHEIITRLDRKFFSGCDSCPMNL